MSCLHCGRKLHDATAPCPRCADANTLVSLATPVVSEQKPTDVVDPEVLGPGEPEGRSTIFFQSTAGQGKEQTGPTGRGGFHFNAWHTTSGGDFFTAQNRAESCLPGCITLAIAGVLGARLGLLASLGFFVFYAAGSAISLVASLQRAMQGQKTPLWIRRAVVWGAASGLTLLLAGGW